MNEYYQSVLKQFISEYEKNHVNPWHNITKEELEIICRNLLSNLKIDDGYLFNYFMNYIIKRIDGKDDNHTKFRTKTINLPFNYRIFGDEVIVNYPDGLRSSSLESINEINISKILNELDDIIIYGNDERKRYEFEKALFNMNLLFSLPSLRDSEELVFEFKNIDGGIESRTINKKDVITIDEQFDIEKYYYGEPGTYKIINDSLIYKHSSVQIEYKDIIEKSIEDIRGLDFNKISKIIIDLRGNIGGNSRLNKPLIDFLSEYKDKKLIVLTDYRVFSSGMLALYDLIKLGCITIGEGIGTSFNSYGDQVWLDIGKYRFAISTCYLNPVMNLRISNKDEINKVSSEVFKPVVFKPDYYVETTKEDFINDYDRVLEFALKNI